MLSTAQTNVIRRAVLGWGHEAQKLKAAEELMELAQALVKAAATKKANYQQIVEERADVEVMLAQLDMIYGGNFREDVAGMVAHKLERLEVTMAQQGIA